MLRYQEDQKVHIRAKTRGAFSDGVCFRFFNSEVQCLNPLLTEDNQRSSFTVLHLQETLLSVGVSTEVENLCVSLTTAQNLPSHVSPWLLFSSFTPDEALWPPAAACVENVWNSAHCDESCTR